MKKLIAIALLSIMATSINAATTESELEARFMGRSGSASEDRRVDEHDLSSILGSGPKTGCHGDTLRADVSITSVNVSLNGNEATVNANYSGKYKRQGWMTPCVQSPPPNGHEDRKVSGTITFTITQLPFKPPKVSWKGENNFGEVSDPGHNSNIFAVRAAKNAISSGL